MVCKQSNTINLHQPCFTPLGMPLYGMRARIVHCCQRHRHSKLSAREHMRALARVKKEGLIVPVHVL